MKVSADIFIKKKNLFYSFMNFTFLLIFFKKFKPYFTGIDDSGVCPYRTQPQIHQYS